MSKQTERSAMALAGMSRRDLIKNLGIAAGVAAVVPSTLVQGASSPSAASSAAPRFVYVGTYSAPHYAPGGKVPSTAKGIYVYKMEANGDLVEVEIVDAENPSFLAVDPSMNYLYAVNELGADDNGKPLGRVSAYKINPSNGKLSFINTELTQGTWPCHCAVHPSGKYLLAANYGTGNFPVFPIQADGSIGKMTDLFQSTGNGTGADPARQGGPHAHMILTNPGAHHIFGVDLGADKVIALDLDESSGKVVPGTVPYVSTVGGGGPRHMAFHPNDQLGYVLNELSSSIDVFNFDPKRGAFTWIQAVDTLPQDSEFGRPVFDPTNPGKVPPGSNTTAEIRVHPSGKWLYATNRGMNSVAVFEIDSASGKLTPTSWVSSQGEIPRGMNIDPSGAFLYVGNQNSDSIAVYGINPDNGNLEGPLHKISSPVPVDFAFGPTA